MGESFIEPSSDKWRPIAETERLSSLDFIRGLALLGVLLVNALSGFRISLLEHILGSHSQQWQVNLTVDMIIAGLIEFKAIALFTLMFGIGIGVQAERAATRSISASRFLVRRFLALLAFGLVHMFLIWNGDILTLYAICGLLIVPLLRLPTVLLVIFGVALIALPIKLPYAGLWHIAEPVIRAHAAFATHIYSEGSLRDILELRWHEAWRFIMPLLIDTLPTTFGLMMLGVAAWRASVVREPGRHHGSLWTILVVGLTVGGLTRSLLVFSRFTGQAFAIPPPFNFVSPDVLLALSYAAGLFLWLRLPRSATIISAISASGQMALTNYLAQSVILGFIFYSYGFGLFGRLGSAVVAILCLIIYAGQLIISRAWLSRYRFGPIEWLWRSVTYGRRQRMLRDVM
jgi:uncharacterized protein